MTPLPPEFFEDGWPHYHPDHDDTSGNTRIVVFPGGIPDNSVNRDLNAIEVSIDDPDRRRLHSVVVFENLIRNYERDHPEVPPGVFGTGPVSGLTRLISELNTGLPEPIRITWDDLALSSGIVTVIDEDI